MTKRKKLLMVLITALLVLIGVFINNKYFFNPINYKKDNITYLDWTWYTNPMSMDYNYLDLNTNNNWRTNKIWDKEEIKTVFEELKKSEEIPEYSNTNPELLKEIIIRPSDGSVALDVFINEDSKRARINSRNTYLKLTRKLTELINRRMKETR